MKPTFLVTLLMTSLASLCLVHHADGSEAPIQSRTVTASPITPGASTTFDFVSQINDEAYRVRIYVPKGKAPAHGYPSLYLLDGNVLFGTFSEAEKNKSQAGDVQAAVIVGIESREGDKEADRTFDFTYSDLTPHEKEIVVDLGSNPRFGGYDKFYNVIEDEIKPRVARLAAVDQSRTALFGWSLGGLFVVHTMLKHPDSFSGYVALSPSLWRDNKSAFNDIPDFEKRVTANHDQLRLFVGVGSLEEQLSQGMLSWPVDHEKFALEVSYARMVGNAKDFSSSVQPFFKKNKFDFIFKIFDGDTHNSVPWSAVNPVLNFIFPIKSNKETGSTK